MLTNSAHQRFPGVALGTWNASLGGTSGPLTSLFAFQPNWSPASCLSFISSSSGRPAGWRGQGEGLIGRGRGVGTWGVGMEPSLPSCPPIHTARQPWIPERNWEAGIWRRSNLHPEIFKLSFWKPPAFFHARPLRLEAHSFLLKICPPQAGVCSARYGRHSSLTLGLN